jgi:ribosomal protein L2
LQIIEQKEETIEEELQQDKGGGHKRCYRLIDFKRNKYDYWKSCFN